MYLSYIWASCPFWWISGGEITKGKLIIQLWPIDTDNYLYLYKQYLYAYKQTRLSETEEYKSLLPRLLHDKQTINIFLVINAHCDSAGLLDIHDYYNL